MSRDTHKSVLVLSGGGSKGIYHLGALHYLEEQNLLHNVDTYIGCSVGSVIAFLHSLGIGAFEIFGCVMEFGGSIVDVSNFNLASFLKTYGLGKLDPMIAVIQNILTNLNINTHMTLRQHHELTHKTFICSVTNVKKMAAEYIDYTSHPNLECIEALRISCSVPIIFPFVELGDSLYVDGGLSDSFPIDLLDDGKNEIIGISLDDGPSLENVLGYVMTLMKIPYHRLHREKIRKLSRRCTCIELRNELETFSIGNPEDSVKREMFVSGYNQCLQIFKKAV